MAIGYFVIKGLDSLITKRIGEIDKRRLVKGQIDRVSIKVEMSSLKAL
jgi:hypothetical protein